MSISKTNREFWSKCWSRSTNLCVGEMHARRVRRVRIRLFAFVFVFVVRRFDTRAMFGYIKKEKIESQNDIRAFGWPTSRPKQARNASARRFVEPKHDTRHWKSISRTTKNNRKTIIYRTSSIIPSRYLHEATQTDGERRPMRVSLVAQFSCRCCYCCWSLWHNFRLFQLVCVTATVSWYASYNNKSYRNANRKIITAPPTWIMAKNYFRNRRVKIEQVIETNETKSIVPCSTESA